MSIKRILSLMLALVLLVGSMPAFAKSAEILVLESLADSAEEEIAEEASVAVEEALPAEEPMEILPELPAPKIIMQPEWQAVEGTGAVLIPAAEKIRFGWEEVEDADFYRVETSRRPAEGEEEVRVEIGRVEENHIDLTAANYSGDWYAIYITAEAADGRVSFDACIFRIEEEKEVAEEIDVSEEEVAEEIDVSADDEKLEIISYPQSVAVAEGEKATVTVDVKGEGLTYTWYLKDAGAASYTKSSITSNTYSVVMNAARDGRRLICYVSDKYGNKIQCPTVLIKMANPLEIISYPQDAAVYNGERVTVQVKATGDGLTYAWYYKNRFDDEYKKSSVTTNTYSIVMDAIRHNRRLICYVYDKYGNKVQCPTVTLKMKAQLQIVNYPYSVTVAEGQQATVSVNATGDGLTYAWYYKDPGESSYTKSDVTTASYSVVMNAARNGRKVICYVYDEYGCSIQCPTVLMKRRKSSLYVSTYPKSVTVDEGEIATVRVKASGDSLTYAWFYKDAGASSYTRSSVTSASYSVEMNAARDGRRLICYVYDEYGDKVQCPTVQIKMRPKVIITQDLQDVGVVDGAKASVTVLATGTDLSYKWYYKDVGASKFTHTTTFTGNTYSVTMSAARDGRQVYCVIADASGYSVTSATATLNMKTPLVITQDIADVSVEEDGDTAKVTVKATGDGLKYAWYYKGPTSTEFYCDSSRKTATYSTTLFYQFSGCQVYCIITDAYGESVRSATATLRIRKDLEIVTNLSSTTYAYEGDKASLFVSVEGDGLRYAWYYKDDGQSEYTLTPTFTGNIYSVTMTAARVGRKVYCKITDMYGETVKTNTTTLKIKQPALLYEKNSDGTLTIVGYEGGTISSLVIPATINGKKVTSIGAYAFDLCTDLRSVTVSNGIKHIGRQAFSRSSLTSLSLPGSIETIEEYAVSNCEKLTSVTLGSGIEHISDFMFVGCSKLTQITLPGTLDSIGEAAFRYCSSLTGISIPNGVTTIKYAAFEYCSSLTSIKIPNSVTALGSSAFYECTALQSVTLSSGIDTIENYTFEHCTRLTSITVPEGVESINSRAFNCGVNLVKVTLPRSVTFINEIAFKTSNPRFFVYSGSYAQTWCENNRKRYTLL